MIQKLIIPVLLFIIISGCSKVEVKNDFEIVSPNILEVRNSSFSGGGHHLIDGPILLQDSDDSNEQHGF